MAMEGPTPVSSLLHSSTIVVAGVFLGMMYIEIGVLMSMVGMVMISLYLSGWYDGKKIIALSTSVHLVVILCAVRWGIYGLVLFHIVTHGFVKASAFVNSGWHIHINRGQDLRGWGVSIGIIVMVGGFVLLCGVGGSLVSNSKEYVLLGVFRIIVMIIRWNYSKNFMNNVDRSSSKYILESGFLFLIVVMGGSGFISVDVIILTFVCVGIRIVSIRNMWVLNR